MKNHNYRQLGQTLILKMLQIKYQYFFLLLKIQLLNKHFLLLLLQDQTSHHNIQNLNSSSLSSLTYHLLN